VDPSQSDLGSERLPDSDDLDDCDQRSCGCQEDAPGQPYSWVLRIPQPYLPKIPSDLHSVYEAGPFTRCNVCEEPLRELGLYEIQKVYRGKEVIFEVALCHRCGEELVRELSQESLEAMKGFLFANFRPTPEAEHCHFCGFPRGLFANYTVVAACEGSALLLPRIVMCERCGERLSELLSRKTREVQSDFVRDHFPGVPADLDLSPSFRGIL
jgi:hypothetical protein